MTRTIGGSPRAMIADGPLVIIRAVLASPVQSASTSSSLDACEQRLAHVERDGPLLQAAQGHRRQERGEIPRPAPRASSRARKVTVGSVVAVALVAAAPAPATKMPAAKAMVARPAIQQSRPRVAHPAPRAAQEVDRGGRLDGHEVADHERGQQRVAARPEPDPDDRTAEPHQGRDQHRSRDRHEMAGQPQGQERLEQQDDAGQLADRPREVGPDRPGDGDREQGHDRREHEHEVAVDLARVAQVAGQDDDEDEDEGELERDVDGVHDSLWSARDVAGIRR